MNKDPVFPRRIADGVFWIGYCNSTTVGGRPFHNHVSQYLVVGSEATLFIDTGTPSSWPKVKGYLETALAGRPLDYVMPTHPEVPHSSALPLVMEAYPDAKIVGDMRDYHLYFPEFASKFINMVPGDALELGGGKKVVFMEAVMKDLPNTLWAYEASTRIWFVSDGFSFAHDAPGMPAHEEPIHRPGDCARMSSELSAGVDVQKASFILRAALYWSRFVNEKILFDRIEWLFNKYPADKIAPAHGNVIDNIEEVLPYIVEAHREAIKREKTGITSES